MPGSPERVVVLGAGSSGESFCAALRRLDDAVSITIVERALLGGECSYWACMPSKTLLRSPELVAAARLAPGTQTTALDVQRVFEWRDKAVDHWEDGEHAEFLASRHVEVVRGEARAVAPGRVEVNGTELPFDALVVATGSSPAIPQIPGLDTVDFWTTADATSAHAVPESLIVLGGGAAGCELAQLYARLGTRVAIVQRAERLLPQADAGAGELLAAAFREEAIAVELGAVVERVEPGVRVSLADGRTIEAEALLVATGRRPNADGLGLERLGAAVGPSGIAVDDRLRAADGVWAIGDVTGIALFTHVGKYQARVAASGVAGRPRVADYRAIPACAFTDPQVAIVGRTEGDGLVSSSWRIDRTSRASTFERPKRPGFVKLIADPGRRVVVGAVAVGPEAGEWLQQITLAIRAEVTVDVLRDTIQPYPTFSEALFFAARDLPL